jgi:zinc transport system substrate-binding protein
MNMNRISRALVAAAAAGLLCAGCGRDAGKGAGRSGKPVVVATVLPVYVLALDVAGENPGVELSLLLPPAAGCPHDYSMSPADAAKLARAKLLLANGAGFEPFLAPGTLAKVNRDLPVADLSEGMKLLPRQAVGSGEAAGHDADHDKDEAGGGHHHHHDEVWNGHTFASPRNAAVMVKRIAEALAKLDPAGAAAYRANAAKTAAQLEELADQLAAAAKTFPNRKVVATHDILAYLARDAGLELVAVIEDEPGQEPGLGVFAKLVERVRADKPAAIFSEPQYSDKPALALSRETGVPVYSLDPFASGKAERGAYLAAMRENLVTLEKALGPKGAVPEKSP